MKMTSNSCPLPKSAALEVAVSSFYRNTFLPEPRNTSSAPLFPGIPHFSTVRSGLGGRSAAKLPHGLLQRLSSGKQFSSSNFPSSRYPHLETALAGEPCTAPPSVRIAPAKEIPFPSVAHIGRVSRPRI